MAKTPTRRPRANGVAEGNTRITVPLPKEVDQQLRAVARQEDRSVAGLVREWIIEKLSEAGEKRSRRVRMGQLAWKTRIANGQTPEEIMKKLRT